MGRFKQRVEELSRKNDVTVTAFKTFPPAPVAYLIKAQEALQKKLPESMLNFFACTNGLKLEWEWKNRVTSTINILPIEAVFGGEFSGMKIEWNDPEDHKDRLWFKEMEKERINFLKQLRPLEIWPGVSEDVAIDLRNDEPEIYFLIPRDEDRKLPLTFEQYLEYLLMFLGFRYWPSLILGEENVIIGDMPLKDCLKELFPEIDVDKYIIPK